MRKWSLIVRTNEPGPVRAWSAEIQAESAYTALTYGLERWRRELQRAYKGSVASFWGDIIAVELTEQP